MQFLVKPLQKLNWSIRNKLGLAFGLILICFVITGLVSVLMLANIKEREGQQQTNRLDLAQMQRCSLNYENELGVYFGIIFVVKSTQAHDGFRDEVFKECLSQPKFVFDTLVRQDFKNTFVNQYTQNLAHFAELDKNLSQNDFETARFNWFVFNAEFKQLTDLIHNQQQQLETRQTMLEKDSSDSILIADIVVLSLTILNLLLAIFLLYLIQLVLVRPLNRLNQHLHRMANGDLDQHLEIANRDEIGKLAQSFELALVSLQKVLRGVQINESLSEVTSYLSIASQEQALGSEEQVTALNQVMLAMQELSGTASQIAINANEVNQLTIITLNQVEQVRAAGQQSQSCNQSMRAIVEKSSASVERIEEQAGQLIQSMEELTNQSEGVNSLVALISSIAQEVHLLALNASVEAAGVGNAANRFNVVVGEVKHLASRTKAAATKAHQLINALQSSILTMQNQVEINQTRIRGVVQANTAIHRSLRGLQQSNDQVMETVLKLQTLANQVGERTVRIKQATYQQAVSSEQVVNFGQTIGAVAKQTANNSRRIAAHSTDLDAVALSLKEVFSLVKLSA